jgi:Lrp/AsnC family transcriptional regulator
MIGYTSQQFIPELLDLSILECLATDANMQFKKIAESLNIDQRTIAKRVNRMKESGVIKHKVEIDWSRLGLGISAYIGSETGLGQGDVVKLYDFIRKEPRVIAAYETIGDEEYFLQVVEENIQSLRSEVLRPLEPLTADLTSSIISSKIKTANDVELIRFLKNRRFPAESLYSYKITDPKN